MLLYKCKCVLITNECYTRCKQCHKEFDRVKLLVEDEAIQTPCRNCGSYEYQEDLKGGLCEDCKYSEI